MIMTVTRKMRKSGTLYVATPIVVMIAAALIIWQWASGLKTIDRGHAPAPSASASASPSVTYEDLSREGVADRDRARDRPFEEQRQTSVSPTVTEEEKYAKQLAMAASSMEDLSVADPGDTRYRAYELFTNFVNDETISRTAKINVLWRLLMSAGSDFQRQFISDFLLQLKPYEKYAQMMYLLKSSDSGNSKLMAIRLLESAFAIPSAYIASSVPDRAYFRRLSTIQRKEIASELEGILLSSHSTPASAPEKFLFDEALWMYTSVARPQDINDMISQLKDQGAINAQEGWELLVRAVWSSEEAQVIILPSLLSELRSAERTNSLEATIKLYDVVAVIAIHDEEVRAELDAFLRKRQPPEWQDYPKELNLEWWIDERYTWSRALGAVNGNRTEVIIETILKGKDPLEQAGFMSRAETEVLDLISEQELATALGSLKTQKSNYPTHLQWPFDYAQIRVAGYEQNDRGLNQG